MAPSNSNQPVDEASEAAGLGWPGVCQGNIHGEWSWQWDVCLPKLSHGKISLKQRDGMLAFGKTNVGGGRARVIYFDW